MGEIVLRDSEARKQTATAGLASWLYHLLARCPWAKLSLHLHFLTSTMEIILTSQGRCEEHRHQYTQSTYNSACKHQEVSGVLLSPLLGPTRLPLCAWGCTSCFYFPSPQYPSYQFPSKTDSVSPENTEAYIFLSSEHLPSRALERSIQWNGSYHWLLVLPVVPLIYLQGPSNLYQMVI